MKLRNIAYATFVAAAAVAFVIGSAVPSEAAKKKKEAAAPPPQEPTCLIRTERTGLRDQGRPEVHLCELLLRDEGRRKWREGRRLQGGQGREVGRHEEVDEEEDLSRRFTPKRLPEELGPLRCSGPFVFLSGICPITDDYFFRGGICSSSAICSFVSGFSRNLSFTASAIAPSRSANLSV